MNRNRVLMALMLGLSVAGAVGLPGAIASAQDSPPYNCRTREVWTPEKERWCAENMPDLVGNDQGATAIEDLVGTEWQLTRLGGNPVLDDVQTTLIVESGDRIVGNGGCNGYFTSVTTDGDSLTIGETGSTMMGCEPAIMQQEAEFFAALQNATRFEQRGDTLRIHSDGLERPLRFTQTSSTPDATAMIDALIGTQWQLAEMNGQPVSDAVQTTLMVESRDRIVGKGGCNGYFAGITVDGNTLTLDPIGSTMAMCEPEVMEQESQFFLALQAATRFEYDGDSLLIYSANSSQPLRFTQLASIADGTNALIDALIGSEWLLEDLNGTGVIDNAQSTLAFVERDAATAEVGIGGGGGCNRYFGGLTVDGETISIGAIGSTRMACAPALMDQESRFFQALEAATRITLDGPYLLLYSEGVEQPLRFTRITPTIESR